jgi:hypothetical protein
MRTLSKGLEARADASLKRGDSCNNQGLEGSTCDVTYVTIPFVDPSHRTEFSQPLG